MIVLPLVGTPTDDRRHPAGVAKGDQIGVIHFHTTVLASGGGILDPSMWILPSGMVNIKRAKCSSYGQFDQEDTLF
jgi:hypothetical protein